MAIGVIGLGYVGLPLAVAFARAGELVLGVDVDDARLRALAAGRSYVEDVPSRELEAVAGRIRAGGDYAPLAQAEAVIICVPTPLSQNREPDLGPLLDCARQLAGVLQRGQLVVLESTTYPGTTREQLAAILQQTGLRAGQDFNLAFSPERIDPGRSDFTLANTPKLVGGLTPACTRRASDLYARVCQQPVPVSCPEVAEMAKLLENIFRSVNIALVNELAILAQRMNIDIWEVIDAAATKPYGFMRFDPGPGMGGHCLPVDPFYLTWRARQYHLSTEFIELAGKINQQMPDWCVARIQAALNDHAKPIRNSNILILGVSYKPGIGDTRESPALRIIQSLKDQGANITYHDPHVPHLHQHNLHNTPLPQALQNQDATVLVTAHPTIDHTTIAKQTPLFIDLRGITRRLGVDAVRL